MATRTVKRIKRASATGKVGIVERKKVYLPGLMLLVGLILASGALAVGLMLYTPEEKVPAKEPERVADRITDAFPRHRVHLGMSPAEVKQLYPNMALRVNVQHQTIGTFFLEGAKHIVTFNKWLSGEKAYRIRYDKTFKTLGEEEILHHFARFYGRIAFNECGTISGQKGRLCQYHWKSDGTKTIEVRTRPVKKGGEYLIRATVVATDTYLESKRRK